MGTLMTDKQMEKLAYQISDSIKDCAWCAIKSECEDSGYGECGGVWYEHIQKVSKIDDPKDHIKYWIDKYESEHPLPRYEDIKED